MDTIHVLHITSVTLYILTKPQLHIHYPKALYSSLSTPQGTHRIFPLIQSNYQVSTSRLFKVWSMTSRGHLLVMSVGILHSNG